MIRKNPKTFGQRTAPLPRVLVTENGVSLTIYPAADIPPVLVTEEQMRQDMLAAGRRGDHMEKARLGRALARLIP